jgi:hypothetical protein
VASDGGVILQVSLTERYILQDAHKILARAIRAVVGSSQELEWAPRPGSCQEKTDFEGNRAFGSNDTSPRVLQHGLVHEPLEETLQPS